MNPLDAKFYRAVEQRRQVLLDKAQSDGSDPKRDIFDHAINELADLPRYCDMMESRLVQMDLDSNSLKRGRYLVHRIRDEGFHMAFLLERFRQELLDLNQALDRPPQDLP